MRINILFLSLSAMFLSCIASGQNQMTAVQSAGPETQNSVVSGDTLRLSIDDAVRIALSENLSVKVADMEVERSGYAKKGTYAALYPTIDATGSYQHTIEKQTFFIGAGEGMQVGRANNLAISGSASMPIVNAALWQSLKISAADVELAVEKARNSRLSTVSEVKNAYYAVLLAKQVFAVYKEVYENALDNYERTQKKHKVQKASELDLVRAKTSLANSIPDVYDSENAVVLALWQLKAVMGISLDRNIDVIGGLMDYSKTMFRDIHSNDNYSLDNNSTMKQLAVQAEQLAKTIKLRQAAYIPSLSLAFQYSYSAYAEDMNFSQFQWTPYSIVGLSLNIPIFSGGKRRSQVKQAQVQASELELTRIDTERKLKIAIRQSLNTMEMAMKGYSSAEEAYGMAQKAYSIAKKSYEVGRSTLTDLNDAQLSLTQSQLALSQSVYKFVVAKTALEETLGQDVK